MDGIKCVVYKANSSGTPARSLCTMPIALLSDSPSPSKELDVSWSVDLC